MFKKSFLKHLAKKEGVSPDWLQTRINRGRIVIPLNRKRQLPRACAIGEGLKIKVNTNIGLSTKELNIQNEIKKLSLAVQCGTDTVMDLSVAPNFQRLRDRLLKQCPVPFGTVPIYEAVIAAERKRKNVEDITFSEMFAVLQKQAEEGVDFFTIHAGILKKAVSRLKERKRTGGIVSRGGALLARWMSFHKKENPLYENFDRILNLAREYNITISLGDALRPGAVADSTDKLQVMELRVLGELVKKCRKRGVQVMVEGPGHIRLDEIPLNMFLEKKICGHAPFYVLGPLPLDIAAGYDHISSAIGGAIAAFCGADFLCVVTPAEHLRHPTVDDIREGVIASKIAGHCVDILRFKDEWEKNKLISHYRARRQWNKIFPLAIDTEKARRYRKNIKLSENICTMCGSFCSLKIAEKCNLL